jgi:hypothetical protein
MTGREIVLGVSLDLWEVDAEFERGSLEGLALALRDALWEKVQVFEDSEFLVVYVGGDRPEALEGPLEIAAREGRFLTGHELPPSLLRRLAAGRTANLPGNQYAYWACECEEYCDESHGEGRLALHIRRPTFHELAVTANGGR